MSPWFFFYHNMKDTIIVPTKIIPKIIAMMRVIDCFSSIIKLCSFSLFYQVFM